VLPHELLPGQMLTYRLCYGLAAGLIVHSQASLSRLLRMMGPRFKTTTEVIPHGHYGELVRDDDMTRAAALELLSLEDKRYIVFFGAIRPYKGIDMLLHAVAAQTEWPSNLRVLIAGHVMAGIAKKELLQLCDGLGILDRVTFDFRYFPEDHIPAIFKIADLVALPYRMIDQSGVLMGAIAAGIPVLCTPVGAFPEIVHSGIGFMASKSSTEALTKTLKQALRQRSSWADMGAKARVEARLYYSWDSIAKKTLRFYQDVLKH
jgi:glycosyltransferase involved in cell wall biosynthesis